MTLTETNLIKQNEQFVTEILQQDPAYFHKLVKGQSPEYFVLACSDSRVSPSVTANMPLGNMFVHRNVANQVVEGDHSFSAGLYYALKHLKVKKILIEGHTQCGGIQAACEMKQEQSNLQKDDGFHLWVSEIQQNVPSKHQCDELTSFELSKLNVLNQIENLKKHPVYIKYGSNVDIIGFVFDLSSGKLQKVT
ncbi:carbonic anhydrase [Chengkuizengella marina]|uniref:carbonic anhydrase n=1 Tax=Chengkuizengella marina TaxID=2507566 RepID=A0A6N9Q0M1_9BACL|nr:carbonic anhydrase [Chengkuizengella marina]NBI28465.1 carbonate dehydratase [Chengkuizengella marina]